MYVGKVPDKGIRMKRPSSARSAYMSDGSRGVHLGSLSETAMIVRQRSCGKKGINTVAVYQFSEAHETKTPSS